MPRLRVHCIGVSVDGFSAGPDQSLENPLGVGGPALMQWFFPTRTFQSMHGDPAAGTTGIDDDFAARSFHNIGAWILGRNMFGPVRGPWPDDSWKGWWGDDPPYHVPTFVLTHHAREPLIMAGGTTFYFVTGGIHEALRLAREAAGGKDVRVGGGVATIRQYLQESLIDEMHLACSPVLLGSGESLFEGINLPALGYRVTSHVASESVTHLQIAKTAS
jgi:dihydrofolate reductase